MSDQILRLRQRIDILVDERDRLRADRDYWRELATSLGDQYESLSMRVHVNQHGAVNVYATHEERLEARRRTWRESKRRKAMRVKAA